MQLESLFDSTIRLRLIKVFVRNPNIGFNQSEIAKKTHIPSSRLKSHLKNLFKLGFIKTKVRKNRKVFLLNHNFPLHFEIQNLILKDSPISEEIFLSQLKKLGQIKLAILAGIFLNSDKKRVDFLLVGDKIKKERLNKLLKDLEAKLGKEIDYTVLTPKEFKYRRSMFDRFINDILEYPHKKLINTLRV